jgi:dihydrofolate reductase
MNEMRTVTLFISTSADGKIARENGDTDWVQDIPATGFDKFYQEIDTLLMGRLTFERLLARGAWPYSGKKTYVFSKSLKNEFGAEIQVVNRDPAAFVEDFKLAGDRRVWLVGGAELIRALMNENMVDEVILNLHPTMLGKGIDLFPLPLHSMFWRLDYSKDLPFGLVQVRYVFLGVQEQD